jgi:hypothetical protein
MRHFPLRETGYAIGFVVLLAALYVGAYFAMVDRQAIPLRMTGGIILYSFPTYRFGDESAAWFFAPMYAIDRRIRSDFWKPEPTDYR